MSGWLIGLGILVAFAVLPLGASVHFDESGAQVRLIVGPLKILLYPRSRKEKKKEKKNKEKRKDSNAAAQEPPKGAPTNPNQKPKKGGSLTDFLPLVEVAWELLGSLRRKLRVNFLQLRLTMAADDPCDLAINYGRAQAAGGALMAQLERLFVIKKRDVQIQCDFTSEQTRVFAHLELTIAVGRLISLGVVYGIRALKTFLNIKKHREGGAEI